LALTLFPRIAEAGIATAEAAAGWVNAVLLATILLRRGHFAFDAPLVRSLPRQLLSCAIMGAFLVFGADYLGASLSSASGFAAQFAALLFLIAGGAIVYFAVAHLTGAADIRAILRNFRRRKAAS